MGVVYKYFRETMDDIASIGVCVRELYGRSQDMSLAYMTSMTGEIWEFVGEEDVQYGTWRGASLGRELPYVDTVEGKPFPTTLTHCVTRVHHANLCDPSEYMNLPYGFVTGRTKERGDLEIGVVYKDEDGFVGCLSSDDYLETFQLVKDPLRLTLHAKSITKDNNPLSRKDFQLADTNGTYFKAGYYRKYDVYAAITVYGQTHLSLIHI